MRLKKKKVKKTVTNRTLKIAESRKLSKEEFMETNGPKYGQVSCGISVNREKKDIFAIQCDPEEEYEWIANKGVFPESKLKQEVENKTEKYVEGFPSTDTKAITPESEPHVIGKPVSPLPGPQNNYQEMENLYDPYQAYEMSSYHRDLSVPDLQALNFYDPYQHYSIDQENDPRQHVHF